jgi:hypothetical protein
MAVGIDPAALAVIECWRDEKRVQVVHTLAHFLKWVYGELFPGRPSYRERKPFREVIFIDEKARRVFLRG